MSSSQPPATAPAAHPQLTQQQIVQLAGQGIHFIRILRTTVLQINEMVNNAPSMKDVDQNILRKMFVRMNDIYGKLEDIAHQLPERTDTTPQLDALAALYNQERADNNIFGAKLPLAITQQKTQVDGYLKGVRQADSSSQYWYFAEQLYKLGGTVPGNSVMYAQRRRLFLDPPALTFTEYTPENNPHSSFINAFFHLKEEAHKKKYGIWLEILENSGQGSVLEIKTGVLVDKQPVITQKTLVVENNGNVDMVVFVAPHEEWKFLDEAGEYGRKVDIMQRSKFSVYQKLTAVANMSLTTLLSHGHDRTPAQIMQNVFHLLSRYHKVFETKCKICGKVMKNYLPCVYFDPRQPAQSLHEGCR